VTGESVRPVELKSESYFWSMLAMGLRPRAASSETTYAPGLSHALALLWVRRETGNAETIDEGPEDTLGLDGLVQTRPGDVGIDVLMN
jgi:hypothetical protein